MISAFLDLKTIQEGEEAISTKKLYQCLGFTARGMGKIYSRFENSRSIFRIFRHLTTLTCLIFVTRSVIKKG